MGQFKPMVKMMTTEPTVELKLKNGGAVAMKKGGSTTKAKKMAMGGDPMMSGEPGLASEMMGAPRMPSGPVGGSAAPVVGPKRPPMSMRRKAMKPPMRPPMRPPMSAPAPMAPPMPSAPMMKKGGNADMMQDKAMMKKAFKQHDMQEHKGGKGTTLKLKHGGMKYATGGVVNGQGGYKKGGLASGGIINTENQGGEYRNTKMHTSKTDHSPAKTGGVKNGNGGGYATGGVAKSNAGGYKNGGASKKFADGGSVQSDGRPVKMAQGAKKPSTPVSINQLSGTFKKGGKVTAAEGRLMSANKAENSSAMKAAKAVKLDQYSKYQKSGKKMAEGGDAQSRENAAARAAFDADERKFNEGLRSDVEDVVTYPLRKGKELFNKVKGSNFVKEVGDFADEYGDLYMKGLGLRSQNAPGPRVTKTKQSVTVSKKRGGSAC
jgi:hypothetical protein